MPKSDIELARMHLEITLKSRVSRLDALQGMRESGLLNGRRETDEDLLALFARVLSERLESQLGKTMRR